MTDSAKKNDENRRTSLPFEKSTVSPSSSLCIPVNSKDTTTSSKNHEATLVVSTVIPTVSKDDAKEETVAGGSKRLANNNKEAPVAKKTKGQGQKEGEIADLAVTLGFKDGDRIEVSWHISSSSNNNNNNNNNTSSNMGQPEQDKNGDADNDDGDDEEEEQEETRHRWWGATLLPFDGTTTPEEPVAIRRLEYDAYPEGGFPEKSIEQVVFLDHETLADPETYEALTYRRLEGEDEKCFAVTDMEAMVDEILQGALRKNQEAWSKMSAAQQAMIAFKIATKKQKLVELLEQHKGIVVTPQVVQQILAQTMAE